MKWIKASERLPGKTWIRIFCHVKTQGGNIDRAIVTWKDDKWIYEYYDQYEVVEWLDESPSESDAVEQKKYWVDALATCLSHITVTGSTDEPISELQSKYTITKK